MDREDDWAEASEAVTPETSATDSDTVYHRLCELESDAEGGWIKEDRHEVSLVRVPTNFLKAVELQAHSHSNVGVAWVRALILEWPGMSLAAVRQMDQDLMPAFLAGCPDFNYYEILAFLSYQDNTIFLRPPPGREHLAPRAPKRKCGQEGQPGTQTGDSQSQKEPRGKQMAKRFAVFQKCAFKSGFAAEGMLCSNPPIPLRVLDFLGTYELINLSLVCKATHQAGHVLLEREIAALPKEFINSKGHPIVAGWDLLKRARKPAVFKGIIGVPSCPEAQIRSGVASPMRVSLPRGFPSRPISGAGDSCTAETGDLPPNPWQILAELEKAGPGSQEHQHLDIAGNSEKVAKIAVPFQLATKGDLGIKRRKQFFYPKQNLSGKTLRLGRPGNLVWEQRTRHAGDPPPQAVYNDDHSAANVRPQPGGRSRTAGGASMSSGRSGGGVENLRGQWPYWAGWRATNYAAIALDTEKAEHVMRYWQEHGCPETRNAQGEKAASVVAAAVRKGQGLLLTVRELADKEYATHQQEMEDKYFEEYGKYPSGLYYPPYQEGWHYAGRSLT